MPSEDTPEGHKYPFNACEILCSDNDFIIDSIIQVFKIDQDGNLIKKPEEPSEEELNETLYKVSQRLENIQIKNEGESDTIDITEDVENVVNTVIIENEEKPVRQIIVNYMSYIGKG
jgi:hypothetical protein